MKNFNWEDFKSGELAISCETKEIAKDFVDSLYKANVLNNLPFKDYYIGKWSHFNDCYRFSKEYDDLCYENSAIYNFSNYRIVKWKIEEEVKPFTNIVNKIKDDLIGQKYVFTVRRHTEHNDNDYYTVTGTIENFDGNQFIVNNEHETRIFTRKNVLEMFKSKR